MTDVPSLDCLFEARTRAFFGHPHVLPSFLGIFRVFTIVLLVVATVFAPMTALGTGIVATACFTVGFVHLRHAPWRDAVKSGLCTIRFFFVLSSGGRLLFALGTALTGREALGHGGLGHLAIAGGIALMGILLYTFPLVPQAAEVSMVAVTLEPLGVRAEYDSLNEELADLKRRERQIADRKTELESHPDINRA